MSGDDLRVTHFRMKSSAVTESIFCSGKEVTKENKRGSNDTGSVYAQAQAPTGSLGIHPSRKLRSSF